MIKEEWRPIIGFEEHYEISSFGRIQTIKSRWKTYRLMKLDTSCKKGHLAIKLMKNGKSSRHWVHRLVLQTFVGPCPEGMECRHFDGDPTNNQLSNLIWGTPKDNWADRRKHGRHIWTPRTNTSGMRGVSFDKKRNKWHAYIGYAPRTNLGWFSDFETACKARLEAEN